MFIHKKNVLPRLTAVPCAVDTALFIGSPEISYCCDIYDVRISRMDQNSCDVFGLV